MRLYPTTTSVHLALAGAALSVVGLVAGEPVVLGFGVASLVGLAIARAATLVSVSRIRCAGLEMVWQRPGAREKARRGETLVVRAEVRNRDTRAARFVGLRVIASPMLEVALEPTAGEVPANGKLDVDVRITAPRVGAHGVFGLALEVLGAPGLFAVPLSFASPLGIDVLPRVAHGAVPRARAGRALLRAEGGASGRLAGDGTSLREVREYRPGDPWRRIAWKASAKRDTLLVREMEHDERDAVLIVLDASVELWAGRLGRAPLDAAVDEAARLAVQHGRAGDLVGLAVIGQRLRARLAPARGSAQTELILATLARASGTHDADRSGDSEEDVAYAVYEHLRPLDPRGLEDVRVTDLDTLARRAEAQLGRAPFRGATALDTTTRARALRGYRAAFGMVAPPRLEPERPATLLTLEELLRDVSRGGHSPTLIHVLAQAPEPQHPIHHALAALRRRRVRVRWTLPVFSPGVEAPPAIARWIDLRVEAAERRARRSLLAAGVEPGPRGAQA